MHFTTVALAASGAVGLVAGHAIGSPALGVVKRDGARKSPLLLDIPGLPPTPDLPAKKKGAISLAATLPFNDIQGDILIGMKKPKELFYFFTINDAAAFKAALKSTIISRITSTQTLLGDVSAQPAAMLNVAFSNTGLQTLGVTDNLGDSIFTGGQFKDASVLKDDDPATNWVQGFQGTSVHGVFLLASDQDSAISDLLDTITGALGTSTTEVHRLQGAARPGDQEGHEHFGFLDGIAQPAISGFNNPLPGQSVINPGVILTGENGDSVTRPSWAKDGSFLAFRQLKQLVPEFNSFLTANPVNGSSDLTGARMIGRWKSGAPIDLSPHEDDPALGADAQRNNNFQFSHTEIAGFDFVSDQSRCPFSAHIRKTHPRDDLKGNTANQIIRAGIPYGPEVTDDEASSGKTSVERGLAFVSYQSVISNGFRFQQNAWANNQNFIFGKNDTTPGFDPIIGQAGNGAARSVSGVDPLDANHDLSIPAFIVSRGGEYFFSPSISALTSKIAA